MLLQELDSGLSIGELLAFVGCRFGILVIKVIVTTLLGASQHTLLLGSENCGRDRTYHPPWNMLSRDHLLEICDRPGKMDS